MMEEPASRTSEHDANYFPWQAVTWQAGSASAISPEVSETKPCTNKAGHDLFGMIGLGADSLGEGCRRRYIFKYAEEILVWDGISVQVKLLCYLGFPVLPNFPADAFCIFCLFLVTSVVF